MREHDARRRVDEIRALYTAMALGAGIPLEQIARIANTVKAEELRVYDINKDRFVVEKGTWDVVWRDSRADDGESMSFAQHSATDAAEALFRRTMPTNYRSLREKLGFVRAAAQNSGRTVLDETALLPDTIYCIESAARLTIVASAGRELRSLYVMYLLQPQNQITDVSTWTNDAVFEAFAGERRAD